MLMNLQRRAGARRFLQSFCGAAVLAAGLPAWAVTYVAVDLQPAGLMDSQGFAIAGGYQAGYASGIPTAGSLQAALWNGSAGTYTNLHPEGFDESIIYGMTATQQVGYAAAPGGVDTHAMLWNGTAASAVDLQPDSYSDTQAWGIAGGQQVGFGMPEEDLAPHAMLWNGSAELFTDLHPTALTELTASYALATDGAYQVGVGSDVNEVFQALLWAGTAASAISLHPDEFSDSVASAVAGSQQVGYGTPESGYQHHALLWTGTAASAADLNPAGFSESEASDTNGFQQVGYGVNADDELHALVWNGSAGSYIDLHTFLPAGVYDLSVATGIDEAGNIVGRAYTAADGQFHAIVWQVPEPASLLLLGLGGTALLARRRK